jgi:hypothetical protein
MTLKISDSSNVKFIIEYKSSFFFLFDSFHQIITQKNVGMFGIAIQMFGHDYGSHRAIAFNGD